MLNLAEVHLLQHNKISIPYKDGIRKIIALSDILYLQADSNYTHLTYVYQSAYHTSTVCRCLEDYEAELNNMGFLRIHRSYIINLTGVEVVNFREHSLIMKNDTTLFFSKSHIEQLNRLFH